MHSYATLITGASLLALAGSAHAALVSLVEVDFESASLGQSTGIAASSLASGFGASASSSAKTGGVEFFANPGSQALVTRFFGDIHFPELSFSSKSSFDLDLIEFFHIHNHNSGQPTFPDYTVTLQLDSGLGFSDLGSFTASAANSRTTVSFAGPGTLGAGAYQLRWVGSDFNDNGINSSQEFFALDNIVLYSDPDAGPRNPAPVPIPATLALIAFGLVGLVGTRARESAARAHA